MVHFLFIFLVTIISVIDFQSHQIPNKLSLSLFFVLMIHPSHFAISLILTEILILGIVLFVCRLGAGDAKLFAILILTNSTVIASTEYLSAFWLVASILLAMEVMKSRTLKGHIAFAPAILLPFALCYLAI